MCMCWNVSIVSCAAESFVRFHRQLIKELKSGVKGHMGILQWPFILPSELEALFFCWFSHSGGWGGVSMTSSCWQKRQSDNGVLRGLKRLIWTLKCHISRVFIIYHLSFLDWVCSTQIQYFHIWLKINVYIWLVHLANMKWHDSKWN